MAHGFEPHELPSAVSTLSVALLRSNENLRDSNTLVSRLQLELDESDAQRDTLQHDLAEAREALVTQRLGSEALTAAAQLRNRAHSTPVALRSLKESFSRCGGAGVSQPTSPCGSARRSPLATHARLATHSHLYAPGAARGFSQRDGSQYASSASDSGHTSEHYGLSSDGRVDLSVDVGAPAEAGRGSGGWCEAARLVHGPAEVDALGQSASQHEAEVEALDASLRTARESCALAESARARLEEELEGAGRARLSLESGLRRAVAEAAAAQREAAAGAGQLYAAEVRALTNKIEIGHALLYRNHTFCISTRPLPVCSTYRGGRTALCSRGSGFNQ